MAPRKPVDPEIAAIAVIVEALDGLDEAAQERALRLVSDRWAAGRADRYASVGSVLDDQVQVDAEDPRR